MISASGGPSVLAIDFGTTYTTAALAFRGQVRLLELDDGPRTPSAVFRPPDGRLMAGVQALNMAPMDPSAFERTPKRVLGFGTVLLGTAAVPDTEIVAAMLEPVAAEARRLLDDQWPDVVCLTHPAAWAAARQQLLVDAARLVGLATPVLLSEPVAAAFYYAGHGAGVPDGAALAVYDLGGGTFDAAIVRRQGEQFETVGQPGGIDPLGGIDFDYRLLSHLGESLSREHGQAWAELTMSQERQWVRHRLRLLDDLRRAKESLSQRASQPVFVEGLNIDVTLTQEDLLRLIRPDLERTVDKLAETLTGAGLTPAQLSGVYLVGGSSRIPLVHSIVWHRLGIRPTTMENPKSVVAVGAAEAQHAVTRAAPHPPHPDPTPPYPPHPDPTPPAGDGAWQRHPDTGTDGRTTDRRSPRGLKLAAVGVGVVAVLAGGSYGISMAAASSDGSGSAPESTFSSTPSPTSSSTPSPTFSSTPASSPSSGLVGPGIISTIGSQADSCGPITSSPPWAAANQEGWSCTFSADGYVAAVYEWPDSTSSQNAYSHWANQPGSRALTSPGGHLTYVATSVSDDTEGLQKPAVYLGFDNRWTVLAYGLGSSTPDAAELINWIDRLYT